jgi:hypothetical protein
MRPEVHLLGMCTIILTFASAIMLAQSRLATISQSALISDPTMAPWLFVILSQVQIFLSLLSAGFPPLKKTVLDLVTNYGAPEQSQSNSRSGKGYALGYLKKKRMSKSQKPTSDHGESYPLPDIRKATRNAEDGGGIAQDISDDDSQTGIVRRHGAVV